MQAGLAMGHYQLQEVRHECKRRKVWLALSLQTAQKVILGITLLQRQWQSVYLSPLGQAESDRNRSLQLPFEVFVFQKGNNCYLVQVKQYISGLSFVEWMTISTTNSLGSGRKGDLSNQVTLMLKLATRLRNISDSKFSLAPLDKFKLVIKGNQPSLLGVWYKVLGIRGEFELIITQNQFEGSLQQQKRKKKVIWELIKFGISLFACEQTQKWKTSEQLLKVVDEKIDGRLKRIYKRLIERYRLGQVEDFRVIEEELKGYWRTQQLNSQFRLVLPLLASQQSHRELKVSKWNRKVEFRREEYHIALKYALERKEEFLGIFILNKVSGNKQSLLYSFFYLPSALQLEFKTIKALYEFLCRQKVKLFIENQTLLNTKDFPSSNGAVKGRCDKEAYSTIQLRECRFFKIGPNDNLSICTSDFPLLNEKVSEEQLHSLEEKMCLSHQLQSLRPSHRVRQAYNMIWLGSQYLQKGNLLKSIQLYRAVLAQCQQSLDPSESIFISLYYNMAVYYQRIGRAQQALVYCFYSLQISNQIKDYLDQTIDTLNLLINVLTYSFGDYHEAEYYIHQTTQVISNTTHIVQARFFNTAGLIYLQMGNPKDSVKSLNKAKEMFQLSGQQGQELGLCCLNLATALSEQGHCQSALIELESAHQRVLKREVWETESMKLLVRLVKKFLNTPASLTVRQIVRAFVVTNMLQKVIGFPRVLKVYLQI